MPVFGERAAPIFNPRHPNEIGRFFTQLESLFIRSAVVLDAEKKKYASVYVDGNTAETWEALEEYTDITKTYHDFKDKLLQLYHQVTLKWILTDLDRLIGERQRIGIHTLQELSDFHLKYNAVSTYLITPTSCQSASNRSPTLGSSTRLSFRRFRCVYKYSTKTITPRCHTN
jgi:hypothetical protein